MKKAIGNVGLATVTSIGLSATFPMIVWVTPVLPAEIDINGQDLTGMTVEEARSAVEQCVNGLAGQKVILSMGGQGVETTAGRLGFHWNNADAANQATSQYAKDSLIKQYMARKDSAPAPVDLGLGTEVGSAKVRGFANTQCQTVATQPQDVTITGEGDQFVIMDSVAGKVVGAAATETAPNEALEGGLGEPVGVTAGVAEQQPAIATETPAIIQGVLGIYTTNFSNSDAARFTGLAIGTARINDHLLIPGEVLSDCECLQPFTTANGYEATAAYKSGQAVDSISGSVYQLTTTLYNASLGAEVEVIRKQNRSMIVTYAKPSRDAAIAGAYGGIKIKSNCSTPTYVEDYTEGRKLTFTTYGKKTRPESRRVEYVSETLGSTGPGEPRLIVDDALAPRAEVKTQSSYAGLRPGLWKVVTVGGVEQERTLFNKDAYNTPKTIYRVGLTLPADVPPDPNTVAPVETVPVEATPVTGVDSEPGVTQLVPTEAAPGPAPTDPAPAQVDPAPTKAAPDPAPVVTPISEVVG